ncbi:hypothetical protein OSTOST_23188, partial [Ostertagia ostertagi]
APECAVRTNINEVRICKSFSNHVVFHWPSRHLRLCDTRRRQRRVYCWDAQPSSIAGPANNNGKSLKAVRGSPTNTNQGNNLPLLNSSDQEVERLLNKIRQSFGIRDSPNPPPYILRNGEMECKDYNTSCSEFQRDGLCVYDIIRWDCPQSCECLRLHRYSITATMLMV